MTTDLITIDAPGELPAAFFDVARAARLDDPTWIPEDSAGLASRFGGDHWWIVSGGRARAWVIPGRGRIAAFDHPEAKTDGRNAGYFGWWVSTGDPAADRTLLDLAGAFLSGLGHTEMIGPVEQTSLFGYRLLDQRQDVLGPQVDEPDTPVAMAAFLRDEGFEPLHSYNTRIVPGDVLPFLNETLVEPANATRDAGFSVVALTPARLSERIDAILDILLDAFGENLAFVGPGRALLRDHLELVMGPKLCPHLSTLVLDADDEVAGWMLTYPHYGPLCYQRRGADAVAAESLNYVEHFPQLQALLEPERPWAVCRTVAHDRRYQGRGLTPLMVEFANHACMERYAGWMLTLSRLDNRTQDFYQPDPEGRRLYSVYSRPISGPDAGLPPRNDHV